LLGLRLFPCTSKRGSFFLVHPSAWKGEVITTERNTLGTDVDGDGLRNGQQRNVNHSSAYKADTDGGHTNGGNKDSIDNTNEVELSLPMSDAEADDGVEDGDEDEDHDATDNEDDRQGTSDECTPGYFLREREEVKVGNLFGLSGKQQRSLLRYSHLLAGMLNVFFIYTPLGDVWAFQLLVQIILVPVILITGVWMWQQARVRKLIIKGRNRGRVK
jgi:hypothetical protein